MSTLRDSFFTPNTVSLDEMEQLQQSGMGSLRRGWESGRIGAERNQLGIDELAARSAGDLQRAAGLRAQNEALGLRQARVAPEIGRVEDINNVGTGLDWAAGQFGQGLASMADPVAAATTVGAAGRLAGMLPGAAGKLGRAVGAFGAPATAFGINQQQMAGEFANNAMQDQALMARTSPQDLYRTANAVGAVGGALDTVIPGVIGHQLTGGALRAGIKSMGPAAKTGLEMAGEGVTELGQGEVGRYALGRLNPDRDLTGDNSDRLNEALGGAVGGGPLIAAGAYADAAYRRAGHTARQIGTKTGEVVDLAKDAYAGSALQSGVDKTVAAGRRKAGDMVDLLDQARGEDGAISLTKLAENARDGGRDLAQRYTVSAEERDLLNLAPPDGIAADPAKHTAWFIDASDKRSQLVADRLSC